MMSDSRNEVGKPKYDPWIFYTTVVCKCIKKYELKC